MSYEDFVLRRHSTPLRISDDREWINITAYGDDWEVEMDAYGDTSNELTYRYRRARFDNLTTDWIAGRPPTGFHKTNIWRATFYPAHPRWSDPEDGAVVIYGRKGTAVGCGDASFCIWMVPGTVQ